MAERNKYYQIVEGMLYNYKKTKVEIKNIELDIEELSNDYNGVGAITYTERTGTTNKFNSSVENEIINKEKKLQYLRAFKRSKEIQVERIDNMLSILTDDEYKLIELRYFKKLQFKEIGEMLCKSDIYLITLRKKIINEKLIPLIKN